MKTWLRLALFRRSLRQLSSKKQYVGSHGKLAPSNDDQEYVARSFLALDITDDPRQMLEDILVIPERTDSRSYREDTVFSTTESAL